MYSAMAEELLKSAAELTDASRGQVAKKNFALTSKQSTTGKPAYPIHDEQHARSALGFVSMHGTPEQKAEVRKDIERKYPHLIKKTAALTGMREELFKIASAGLLAKEAVSPRWVRTHAGAGAWQHMLKDLRSPSALDRTMLPGRHSLRERVEQSKALSESLPAGRGSLKRQQVVDAAEAAISRAEERSKEKFGAAGLVGRISGALKGEKGTHIAEIAGLGTLAALPADTLQAKLRSRKGEDWEHKSLLGGERGHAIGDIAGLGVLAAPSIAHLAGRHT